MYKSNFIYLWSSFLVSSIGDWLYRLALPIIILQKTGSAYHAATVFGVSFISWVLFSLIGGSLADNFSKKKTLILGNFFAVFASLFLITVMSFPQLNFNLLYFTVFILASVDPLIHPSFQSIIPEIVINVQLVRANAMIQTIDNTLSIMGPLTGGMIVMLLGGVNALWIDTISFIVAIGILCLLPKQTESKRREHIIRKLWFDIVEGANYSFHQRVIFSGSMMFLFTNFALNMFEAKFIFYMTKTLNYPLVDATIAMSIGGVGALLAGALGTQVVSRFRAGTLLSSSTILAGLSTLLLLVSTSYVYIGVILGLISFFGTINVITYFTLRQRTVPKEILGRVVSVTRMISYASIPVGAWFGGLLLDLGEPMFMVIMIAGIIRTFAGIMAKLSPLGKEN
ncbi:MFS transporter [Leuconostoc gelidum subsp. gasicomitatum]|uniref:MFS transporter n=1 Tax=Leuconostoc gasicomitatum TaxID=115778 RepID=UPI000744AEE9|nr:MFS transporter [Leuconostoc gasicomitatum]MBZ5953210.1 MFS transporter [Leuconostoc gasicomitatum]MBZ5988532.1 MFS transporter [Leuconostoc gasicomitatum]MBZ5990797.1 MFS transporter [Leuconostoc gasicomitatum]CUR62716.1 Drug antiporter protein [Leuconostoc gasicomitatum KG16-1]